MEEKFCGLNLSKHCIGNSCRFWRGWKKGEEVRGDCVIVLAMNNLQWLDTRAPE